MYSRPLSLNYWIVAHFVAKMSEVLGARASSEATLYRMICNISVNSFKVTAVQLDPIYVCFYTDSLQLFI